MRLGGRLGAGTLGADRGVPPSPFLHVSGDKRMLARPVVRPCPRVGRGLRSGKLSPAVAERAGILEFFEGAVDRSELLANVPDHASNVGPEALLAGP